MAAVMQPVYDTYDSLALSSGQRFYQASSATTSTKNLAFSNSSGCPSVPSSDYSPTSTYQSSGFKVTDIQLCQSPGSDINNLQGNLTQLPELTRTPSPLTPSPVRLSSVALNALLKDSSYIGDFHGMDDAAQSIRLPQQANTTGNMDCPDRYGNSHDAAYQGSHAMDSAVAAAILQAAAELAQKRASPNTNTPPMMPNNHYLSPPVSQPPARVQYAQQHRAPANPRLQNAMNDAQRSQSQPQAPGPSAQQWHSSAAMLAEEMAQQLALSEPSASTASETWAHLSSGAYSLASGTNADEGEWVLVPAGQALHQMQQGPHQVQQVHAMPQSQAAPAAQHQMLLVAPQHQEQQPQLLQVPAGAQLSGAQVMYIPAQYVLVPAGNVGPGPAPAAPQPAPTRPTNSGSYNDHRPGRAQAQVQRSRQGRAPQQRPMPPPGLATAGQSTALPSSRVFVGNLQCQITEVELGQLFAPYGRVLRIKVMYNSRRMCRPRSQWRSREFGFVDFSTPAEAQRAIARLHGAVLPGLTKDGSQLIVQYVKGEGAVGSIVMM